MLKKVLAGFLALTMIFAVAGCSGKDGGKNSGGDTISLIIPGDHQADTKAVVEAANKIVEPALGAKLDLQFIDTSAYSEKMKMKMISRENMDVIWTGYLLPYETLIENGSLTDITEMLDSTPALKESIPEYAWESVTTDKKIYGVPNIQINASQYGAVVKSDLAEKYGLDVEAVKSPDDLEPFMEQVKQNEKGIYPIRLKFGPMLWAYDKYATVGTEALGVAIDDEKCKVVNMLDVPEYIEGINKVREWYKKGYIRKDVATANDDATVENQGRYAIIANTMKPGIEASYVQSKGYDVKSVEFTDWYYSGESTRLTMLGVSTTSKQPEKALKLIELLNTNTELYNLLSFGVESKHYTKNEDGKIKYVENSGYKPAADWKFGNQFNAYLLENQDDNVWEETKKINDEAKRSYLKGFIFDPNNVVTEIAQITTVYEEMGSVLKNGLDDPENYLDDYRKKLKVAGLDKVQKEVQKQIDEYLKSLK